MPTHLGHNGETAAREAGQVSRSGSKDNKNRAAGAIKALGRCVVVPFIRRLFCQLTNCLTLHDYGIGIDFGADRKG